MLARLGLGATLLPKMVRSFTSPNNGSILSQTYINKGLPNSHRVFPIDLLRPIQSREFHATDSKVKYLDFRHRFATHHLRLHLLLIRKQKMKKHQRRKWRKKFKCLLAKQRLKREIAKEKQFRVELLSMIRMAEQFDPKEYALRKLSEIHNKPRELSREERLEQLKELIRKNRYQVTYIKPKHQRAEL